MASRTERSPSRCGPCDRRRRPGSFPNSRGIVLGCALFSVPTIGAFVPPPLRTRPFPAALLATPGVDLDGGAPSMPGWKGGELDRLTDWATAKQSNRPIICEYDPDAAWLWKKWRGTVLRMTIVPIVGILALGAAVDASVHALTVSDPWPFLAVPPAEDPLIQSLLGINKLWEYQLTLCTFILTFFTSEAYNHWRTVYLTTRAIQGRINDICLLITLGAARGDCTEWGCGVDGSYENIATGTTTGYSEDSARLVGRCTRLIKLSHTFFWAATPTLSNGVQVDKKTLLDRLWNVLDGEHESNELDADIGPLLLTPAGLDRLVERRQLTSLERNALVRSDLPPSQYSYVLMEWVGLHALDGMRTGTLMGGPGLEENLLSQITRLRAEYFNIGDYAAGRMPLAYVQLVQVLVDSLVLLAPFALYPELGSLSVPLSGLLTLFYKGLLELSKSFLDPFGVEGHPYQNIRVDVLVSELNFGAANRWVKAGESLPSDENVQLDDQNMVNGEEIKGQNMVNGD